jgi:hypothetical protein
MCACARARIESVRESACIVVGLRVCECVCVPTEALTAMLARPAPQNGETPLFTASKNGHAEVVRALLAKGADVLAKTNVSIARACALCPYRSLRVTYLQNAHDHL